jgi:hypothetical protein
MAPHAPFNGLLPCARPQDPALQAHWQEKLMGSDRTFKRPKLELADSLILMANSMFEIGRRQGSVEHLYLALEAIHLAAALMHNNMDLVHDVLSHLELLSQHVARALTHALPLIKADKLAELVEVYGAACDACERRDLIQALLVRRARGERRGLDAGCWEAEQWAVEGSCGDCGHICLVSCGLECRGLHRDQRCRLVGRPALTAEPESGSSPCPTHVPAGPAVAAGAL